MSEVGLSDSEIKVNKTSKPVEQVEQAGSQSRISRLKDLLGKIKTRRVGNNNVSESGTVGNSEDTLPEVEVDKQKGILEQKPTEEILQDEQKSAEAADTEPIKQETIEEICDVMAKVPNIDEHYGHDIPYRTEMRMQTDGVFDEETGLYIEASYIPSGSPTLPISRLERSVPGLSLVLSTPPLKDDGTTAISLSKMGEALRKIYGDSDERLLSGLGYKVGEEGQPDRVKFELDCDDGEDVLSEFSEVFGQQRPVINRYASQRQVLETGGQFLKEIVERAAQKQIEASEKNKQQTQQVIDKVKDEATANDESNAYQYAYHATDRRNIPNISQNGLQPSGEKSKEPGTIFVTNWDSATQYLAKGEEGVLYRFKVKDMPEVAESWHYDEVKGFHAGVTATPLAISADHLDFSLDRGVTWMPAVPRRTKQVA